MKGDTYGVEAWGDYRLTPWWRVSASYDWLHEDLSFAPGASQILGSPRPATIRASRPRCARR